jgi:tRNA threonylcarbamoyladenosine biosynthesis protein TsaB
MNLAIKTDGPVTQLILINESSVQVSDPTEWESGRLLSEDLLGRIYKYVDSNNVSIVDLKGLIIYSGPGSFTSLRIGHSVANALSDGLGIPIVGVLGDNWIKDGIIKLHEAKMGNIAMPFYGSEAHITLTKS